MLSLYLRNLFFTLLHPGIVTGLIPYWILKNENGLIKEIGFLQVSGILIGFLGFVILLACIKRFADEGKGTLSPADPTKRLVINGLYRYSRNPMYVGVMGILIGEAIFFNNFWLLVFMLLVFILFNIFIFLIEEPRLKRDFGKDYIVYCNRVRRWL